MSSDDQFDFEPPSGPPSGQLPPSQPPQQPGTFPTPGQEQTPLFPPSQAGAPPNVPPAQGFPPPGQGAPQPGLQYGQPGQQQPVPQDPYGQQQQQYAQPGGHQAYPPAQAVPQKKSKKWLWILLAIPLLLLLGIGGCTALVISSVGAPIDATNAFVADLDNGDYAAAYNQLCTSTKGAADPDQWAAEAEAGIGGEITDFSFTEASVSSSSGQQSTATVSGTIEVDGIARSGTYNLVKEGDDWRVCTAS
jgi:hypothetical protein